MPDAPSARPRLPARLRDRVLRWDRRTARRRWAQGGHDAAIEVHDAACAKSTDGADARCHHECVGARGSPIGIRGIKLCLPGRRLLPGSVVIGSRDGSVARNRCGSPVSRVETAIHTHAPPEMGDQGHGCHQYDRPSLCASCHAPLTNRAFRSSCGYDVSSPCVRSPTSR